MDEPRLSAHEQQAWDELTGQLADVGELAQRQQRRRTSLRVAAFVAATLATLGALWVPPLVVCFPVAAWLGVQLVERDRLPQRVASSLARRVRDSIPPHTPGPQD